MTLRALPAAALALCLTLPSSPRATGADCAGHPHPGNGHGKLLRLDIVAPAEGAVVKGTVEIRVEASARRMRQVDLLLDGALLATLTPPFSYAWDTSAVAAGPHALVARWQKGKRLVESAPRSVVVQGVPSSRWEVLGGGRVVTPGAPDGGYVPSVTVDSAGTVMVGWMRRLDAADPFGPRDAAVARWDGTAWTDMGSTMDAVDPQDPSGTAPSSPLLSLDATGAPFAFWSAVPLSGETLFRSARWGGADWIRADGPAPVPRPRIAYYEVTPGPSEPVAFIAEADSSPVVSRVEIWDGASWSPLAAPPPIFPAHVAVDGAGQIWLAGFPETAFRWDGTAWVPAGSFTFANDLRIAARGPDVVVAYLFPAECTDGSSCAEVRVERWTGTEWVRLGGAANGQPQAVGDLRLQLDAAGSPVVTWRSEAAVHASRWDGAAWEQLGAALTAPWIGDVSLAIDPSGAPVIAVDVIDLASGRPDTWVVRLAR